MDPSKTLLVLAPNRIRQLGEALIALMCPFALWLALAHTEPRHHVGWSIGLVILLSTCTVFIVRRVLRDYPTVTVDLERQQIDWIPLIGDRISFGTARIIGFSSTTRSLDTDTHDAGIAIYVPLLGHFELKLSTHPQLRSLLNQFEQWQVPFLGEEHVWRFVGKHRYKFDK